MIDEALSYVEGEMEKATHSVCTRQLQDDANRLKCKKNQQKKESRYLSMIRKTMKVDDGSGCWRALRVFAEEGESVRECKGK